MVHNLILFKILKFVKEIHREVFHKYHVVRLGPMLDKYVSYSFFHGTCQGHGRICDVCMVLFRYQKHYSRLELGIEVVTSTHSKFLSFLGLLTSIRCKMILSLKLGGDYLVIIISFYELMILLLLHWNVGRVGLEHFMKNLLILGSFSFTKILIC